MENFISEENRIREGLYISICILQIISVKVIDLKLNRSDEWIIRYYSCPFLRTYERINRDERTLSNCLEEIIVLLN